MNSSFTEFLYDCGIIYCRCLKKQKGFKEKADGSMDRKQTCWLVLPAPAEVTWQISERVIKWQVCWGWDSHVSSRTCYTICRWPDSMLVKATGDAWGKEEWWGQWFGSLKSPPGTCTVSGRKLVGKRLCCRFWIKLCSCLKNRDFNVKPAEAAVKKIIA